MTLMRCVFGVLALVLLAGTVFADSFFSQESLNDTQVFIQPPSTGGTIINISVVAFAPATSTGGTTAANMMEQWARECAGEANRMACIEGKALQANAQSRDYKFNLTYVPSAHFVVEYFNPQANSYRGQWSAVPGCEDVIADREGTAYRPSSTGDPTQYTYYYGQCNLAPVTQGGRAYIRATFVPQPSQPLSQSSAEYEFNNANVTPASQFAQDLQNFINGVSQAGGQGVGAGGMLPCISIFMIMGLLLASLYFAGKSPISLLDITTPKLPAPKGVTASGQILAPFGYTEMKKVTGDKMREAARAAGVTASVMAGGLRGDAEYERVMGRVRAATGTAADRAAASGPAGVAQQKKIAEAFVTAGRSVGIRGRELEALASLPYHYGEREHKLVAQILQALEARGGRDALLAMTLKDYMYSLRTFQSLEVLTAHPAVGQRSAMHYRITSTLGKFYGANRYALLSGVVMAGTDSAFRTMRVMGRMGKTVVTETPHLARATARTTMEMIGGHRMMEELEAKARTSPTAAWLTSQMQKHPSQVIVGSMFPINDKMGHLYKTLHNEVLRDEMRYVLAQLLKSRKFGMRFDITEQELVEMSHKDFDILKRIGYKPSAELAEAEAQIRKVLSNTSLGGQEKLAQLTKLAESHGAYIDHQMLNFSQRVMAIEASPQAEHMKFISLQALLEEQNKVRLAARGSAIVNEDRFYCHVGGDSLKGNEAAKTMLLRTMVWDAENGFLRGGIKEEAISFRLNMVNRGVGLLDLSKEGALGATMAQLPEFMRNPNDLKQLSQRNKDELTMLFDAEGRKAFQQFSNGKSMNQASIDEIVKFMYGGLMPRSGDIDKKTGRMAWRAADQELELPKNYTLVDVKRHWVTALDPRENFAIGQSTESRFTKSYAPFFSASIEAQLNRLPGSASWTVEQRAQMAKKLFVSEQVLTDLEQRFNSVFGQNTYGTTRETNRFYTGIVAGFMEKAMQEKGLDNNHPDVTFLQKMDMTSSKDLAKLKELLETHKDAYQRVIARDMTYDDVAKSNKAVVMLHEGGYAYYKKGMMLSDADRILAGGAVIQDKVTGQKRPFIPEDVVVTFAGRDDLQHKFQKVRSSKDPNEWQPVVQEAIDWAKSGARSYEKEKVLAAVLWEYATKTYDYDKFWKESAVTVEAKRNVMPVASSVLRFFGVEGHTVTPVIKPFRDIGMHMGDYVSKVALASGGELLRTSYDITAVSSQLRMHSFHLASKIQSGEILNGLTEEEKVAYRAVANMHGPYLQTWQFAIDRNPWRISSSFGTHQAWAASFHYGPAVPFSVKDNLRAYMSKGEYAGFMAFHGFPMDFAGKMLRPYVSMLRGMQMSMQGYASKWDYVPDALRQWNYTEPRLLEAMQSLNPGSFKWFGGKRSETMAKLNVFGGSLERHQLAGHDYMAGLRQAPQELFLQKKGVYANARTFDVNPAESYYDYRLTMKSDAPMAEYLFRAKEATYLADKAFQQAAMDNTTRRTVSAEALAIRRDQELRGFGAIQNALFGWANPIAFLWHMPVPLMPQSATPKDIVAKYVARSKHGYGGGFGDGLKGMAEGMGRGVSKLVQPHKMSMIVYCPKCGMSNYRGSMCKNLQCRTALY